MPTLEERVAALEDQMAAIENGKYQMSYSGEELEATLDFVSERRLKSGRELATSVSGAPGTYWAITDIPSNYYTKAPTFAIQLIYRLRSTGNEYIVPITSAHWAKESYKYKLYVTTSATIPNDVTLMIAYIFFEQAE